MRFISMKNQHLVGIILIFCNHLKQIQGFIIHGLFFTPGKSENKTPNGFHTCPVVLWDF